MIVDQELANKVTAVFHLDADSFSIPFLIEYATEAVIALEALEAIEAKSKKGRLRKRRDRQAKIMLVSTLFKVQQHFEELQTITNSKANA